MLALKAGGRGDVTKTHVLWSFGNGPDVPTPVTDGTYVYVNSEAELRQTLRRHRRTGDHVNRFKGLGEMNPSQLRETVFDPETRHLQQVSVEDAAQVADTVKLLMGNDAAARREWIEEAAPDVEVQV